MLSMRELKDGRIAYVFGGEYAEKAKALFPKVSTQLIGADVEQIEVKDKRRTLSDIRTSVEGVSENKFAPPKLALNIKKTTAGIPKNKDEIRQDIRALITELCSRDRLKYGVAWNKAYRILFDKTGFDVRRIEPTLNRGKPSLVDTVLDNGKGMDLVRVLRNYLDK